MNLTTAQKATVKAWLDANAPALGDDAAAAALNAAANPAYSVWRTSVPVTDIYNLTDAEGNVWSWANYIQQSVVQQDGWKQMFIVGQVTNMSQQNVRTGILAIYGNSGAGKTQKDHCLSIGRRLATVYEQLFVTAVSPVVVNTGNDVGSRGSTTNPDMLGIGSDGNPIQGAITAQNVSDIRGGL